jgi:putative hydrolase of HD superfamily
LKFLNFLHASEGLKDELRHSYTSKSRQESVADHSWRMALMAIVLEPSEGVDVLKCLKMAIVHDLPEALAGDTFALQARDGRKQKARELAAMKVLCKKLGDSREFNELLKLWLLNSNRFPPKNLVS